MSHPDPDTIALYLLDGAPDPALETHLERCPTCAETLANEARLELELHALGELLAEEQTAEPRSASPAFLPPLVLAAAALLLTLAASRLFGVDETPPASPPPPDHAPVFVADSSVLSATADAGVHAP
ncbi:MAG: hypothetical protein AAGF12_34690 [Myxococcota bacterium]